MSGYIAGLSCLALVLSPLFIPIAVTVVHCVRNWRPSPQVVKPAAARQLRAPEPKAAPGSNPWGRLRVPAE
jgi:hypothetical protein